MANNQLRRTKIDDHDWMRQSFMIPHKVDALHAGNTKPNGDKLDSDLQLRTRFFSSASLKFATTVLGGNIVMNPMPQFTKFCDPRVPGLNPNKDNALGRWYNEAIDDNKHLITVAAGFPAYNSLTNFWTGFYNSEAALVARTGRSRSIFYDIGRVAGFVVGLFSPWLVAYSVGAAFMRYATGATQTKYYYFKSAMPVYWNTVSGFANELAVRTGLIAPVIKKDSFSTMDDRDALTPAEVRSINKYMPDLIDSYDAETGAGNGINMYAVGTKYSRMASRAFTKMQDFYRDRDYSYSLQEDSEAMINSVREALEKSNRPTRSFLDYLKEWTGNGPGASTEASAAATLNPDGTEASAEKPDKLVEYVVGAEMKNNDESKVASWSDFYIAELNDGAAYVSFRVDSQNQPNESFTSSVGDSDVQTNFNNTSGGARSTRFSMADGNIGGGPMGEFIGSVLGAAKDVAIGLADSVGLGGAAALGGNAFVDIPKIVNSTSTTMPTMSYTVKLRTPYNNRYSRFVNIWVPFVMLVSLATPLSTGPASYTNPFLVQIYDRGRAQSRLAAMTSMSVTRGTTHLAFNKIGEPLGIDLTFEFTELSSIMHMPISSGFSIKEGIRDIFDGESLYNDYVAVLSSMSLREQIYVGERMKLGLTKYLKNADSWFSVAHAMNWMGDLGISKILSIPFPGALNR